jgi:hypothetical protein
MFQLINSTIVSIVELMGGEKHFLANFELEFTKIHGHHNPSIIKLHRYLADIRFYAPAVFSRSAISTISPFLTT